VNEFTYQDYPEMVCSLEITFYIRLIWISFLNPWFSLVVCNRDGIDQKLTRICTQTITISNNLCPPMPTYSMTCAHPCYSNCAHVFKNCVMCITRLHQVLVGSDKKKVVHCRWA
jgi:hypothetical protein